MEIKRVNPFQSIYDAINGEKSLVKILHPLDAPRLLDVELTNVCNFRCLMCLGQTSQIQRKKGFMSDDVFQRLLDEVKLHQIPVRFIRWGEPFLHKRIISYICKLHEKGVFVHVNTNGYNLSEKVMQELIEIPLESIKFSFQGVDRRGYQEMRNRDSFDQLIEKIALLYRKRGERLYPYMHISTTITDETPAQVNLFRDKVGQFVDQVSIGRTVLESIDHGSFNLSTQEKDRLLALKAKETVVKQHPDCPEVFDKLSVNFDGTVSACCMDFDNMMVVGDLKRQSLREIWESERLAFYRKELAAMNHHKFVLCRSCYDYLEIETPGVQKID